MPAFAFDIQFITDSSFEKSPIIKYFVQFENYKIAKHNFIRSNNSLDPKEFGCFPKSIITEYVYRLRFKINNKKCDFISCNQTNKYLDNITKVFDIDALCGVLQYREVSKSLKFGLDVEPLDKKQMNIKFLIQTDQKIINIKDL